MVFGEITEAGRPVQANERLVGKKEELADHSKWPAAHSSHFIFSILNPSTISGQPRSESELFLGFLHIY